MKLIEQMIEHNFRMMTNRASECNTCGNMKGLDSSCLECTFSHKELNQLFHHDR